MVETSELTRSVVVAKIQIENERKSHQLDQIHHRKKRLDDARYFQVAAVRIWCDAPTQVRHVRQHNLVAQNETFTRD